MSTNFPSSRHQLALSQPTGYRRWVRVTFSRSGMSKVLEPVSGRLTQDARRKGRWDGQLTFSGIDVIPERPGDLLTPFGTRATTELGLELLDGSIASVPYGTYIVEKTNLTLTANDRNVEVNLIDLSDAVERYRFESPITIPGNTDVADVVNIVITNRTGINPEVSPTGKVLTNQRVLGLDPETGPWSELQDILSGVSLKAWYDRSGSIVVSSTVPDASSAYSLDSLTSLNIDFDTVPPNVVVARGEPIEGDPVQAVAIDDNPSSPTYAGTGPGTSPYGRKTRFFSSPVIETLSQAQSAAQSILNSHLGQGASYTAVRPYDPTIDADDVTSIRGKILVIDSSTLQLTGETVLKVREL